MRAFAAAPHGFVTGELEPVEAALLTQLATQVVALLIEADAAQPGPAVSRLLPDAYHGDQEASAEFRRFTAEGLTERKVRNARAVITAVAAAYAADGPTEVLLDPQTTQAFLRSLTDIRLVLATRLGIESDSGIDSDSAIDSDGDSDGQHSPSASSDDEVIMLSDVYEWLGWVQESLVAAVDV